MPKQEPTERAVFRLPETHHRLIGELCFNPNIPFRTPSDLYRYGVELVIAQLSDHITDPDLQEMAKLIQVDRRIKVKENLDELKRNVESRAPRWGLKPYE